MQSRMILSDLKELLIFPFRDKESQGRLWIAIALTFAGFLIPLVPNLFVMGYAGVIMRKMIVDKEEPSMPEWNNWNELLTLGFRLFSIISILILPAFIPFVLGYILMIMPVFLPAFMDMSSPVGGMEWFFGTFMLATFAGLALWGLGVLMVAPIMIAMPPSLGYAIEKDSFAAGLKFREWWQVFKANRAGFIIALLLALGLSILMSLTMQFLYMTVILCFLFPFVISIIGGYLNIVVYALYAQAYREAREKMEAEK